LDFVGNKIVAEFLRLAPVFHQTLFEGAVPVRELSPGGIESGEILAQRLQVVQAGPKGKISELS
jgi:hypothetical protein